MRTYFYPIWLKEENNIKQRWQKKMNVVNTIAMDKNKTIERNWKREREKSRKKEVDKRMAGRFEEKRMSEAEKERFSKMLFQNNSHFTLGARERDRDERRERAKGIWRKKKNLFISCEGKKHSRNSNTLREREKRNVLEQRINE